MKAVMGMSLVADDFKKGQCHRCPFGTMKIIGQSNLGRYCSLLDRSTKTFRPSKCPILISKDKTFVNLSELNEWIQSTRERNQDE